MMSEAAQDCTPARPLTRSLATTRLGLAMKATHCIIQDCTDALIARGLCSRHYQQWMKDPEGVPSQPRRKDIIRPCSVEGCGKVHFALGLCSMHRARLTRHGNLIGQIPHGETTESRFERYTAKTADCWTWIGARSPAGYGRIRVPGKQVYAHRWSYERHHGPIPEGMFVMHACDNPPCVNPAHLSVGLPVENAQDMARKGRGRNQFSGRP